MFALFNGCSKIKYFPDISKWNISNAIDISGMFSYYSSLEELPDLSNWNTKKNVKWFFCICLVYLIIALK